MNNIPSIAFVGEIRYYIDEYLDSNILFKMNTEVLRAKFQHDLQTWVDKLLTDIPSMFSIVQVICDGTNNPVDVIDNNELRIDVKCKHAINDAWLTIQTHINKYGSR